MMTDYAAGHHDAHAREGTIFDIGYQKYTGLREGRRRTRMAIYKDGLRTAMGLGRGARAKVLPWLFFGVMLLIAFILILVAGAQGQDGSEAVANFQPNYYGITSIILFLFAAVAAPELLCPDRRDGVITLYFVRPLTGSDYIIARWCAFFTVTALVALIPQFILWMG